LRIAASEHRAIVAALASRDGRAAARVMHQHVMRTYERLMSLLATLPARSHAETVG
jgi:DNA-binding GntR family transcriptional regulator